MEAVLSSSALYFDLLGSSGCDTRNLNINYPFALHNGNGSLGRILKGRTLKSRYHRTNITEQVLPSVEFIAP